MPELPEVETIRRQLAEALPGSEFVSVLRVEPGMLRDCGPEDLESHLPGARVALIERVGKFLVVQLDPVKSNAAPVYLTIHLGMTGQLLIDPPGTGDHIRFAFVLRSRHGKTCHLEFRDMRKFGRLHLTIEGPAPRLSLLGPDAWQGDWDLEYLAQRLAGRKTPLKAFLLDQHHLSGIGNIYSDEILWWAKLCPLRPCLTLGPRETARLAVEIRRVLGEGVRLLGCSISDFMDTKGNPGEFQKWLRAYGRQGESCFRCGAVLAQVVVAGRGSVYCPQCQPQKASPE